MQNLIVVVLMLGAFLGAGCSIQGGFKQAVGSYGRVTAEQMQTARVLLRQCRTGNPVACDTVDRSLETQQRAARSLAEAADQN